MPASWVLCAVRRRHDGTSTESRAAAILTAARRRSDDPTYRWLTFDKMCSGAVSGVPALNGGAGAYSICSWISWAVSDPISSAAMLNAKSIPAVTPPLVITSPSRATRLRSGVAPKAVKNSLANQWQAARLPRSSPAAPSASDPVHTDVMKRAVVASRRSSARKASSRMASSMPAPPATQMMSHESISERRCNPPTMILPRLEFLRLSYSPGVRVRPECGKKPCAARRNRGPARQGTARTR